MKFNDNGWYLPDIPGIDRAHYIWARQSETACGIDISNIKFSALPAHKVCKTCRAHFEVDYPNIDKFPHESFDKRFNQILLFNQIFG